MVSRTCWRRSRRCRGRIVYATFGFSDQAMLDEGGMWPTSFALKQLTPTAEARIRALVQRALS